MVDATKAFDKIKFDIVINKLKSSTLPKPIVDILAFMFSNTFAAVKFHNSVTAPWKIGNGTRQGGILSPLIFSYYINEILNEISSMSVGCSLGGNRSNILCYADDMCLLAPSATALQILLSLLESRLTGVGLIANVSKCAYLVFRGKSRDPTLTFNVQLKGQSLQRVSTFKYLGIILSDDISIVPDVERATSSFLKQFYAMYAKFHAMNDQLLHYLFQTYTSSFYGSELWNGSLCYKNINKIAVTYHKAVKRIARLNVWDSNHLACNRVGVPIFKHLIAKRAVLFFYSLVNAESSCIKPYRYYFRFHSDMRDKLNKLFMKNYGIIKFTDNPLCTLISRIDYVERFEPRQTQYVT